MLATLVLPSVVLAAKPVETGKPRPPSEGTSTPIGYDISWPQCNSKLPTGQAFGIVGINGGNAANTNPCLAEQLEWASQSTGEIAKQPAIQLYINTANPGEVREKAAAWPNTNTDRTGYKTPNPYGQTCDWANSLECSWQYGWDRALEAEIDRFAPAARQAGILEGAINYTWWLDVETMNTWQSGSEAALMKNVAALEGFASYFKNKNVKVGLYSTKTQWTQITGNHIGINSNLNGLDNWRPSGSNLNNAISNCGVPPLTDGGIISLTQYVQKRLDHNHSCI